MVELTLVQEAFSIASFDSDVVVNTKFLAVFFFRIESEVVYFPAVVKFADDEVRTRSLLVELEVLL